MGDKYLNQLPEFTGSPINSWIIANNSDETETFKIKREDFLDGVVEINNYGDKRFLVSDGTKDGINALSGVTLDTTWGFNELHVDDIFSERLGRSTWWHGQDTRMTTGIPLSDKYKFKPSIYYDVDDKITASLVLTDPSYFWSYYIYDKKFWVNNISIQNYKISNDANEGVWFYYIRYSTTDTNNPIMMLTQTPWNIVNGDVLLFIFYFNNDTKTVTWVGDERHTAGRDIYQHARNHAQGAILRSGFLTSTYNKLTNLSGNTDDNFGRAQLQIAGGSFYDEDLVNSILHNDFSIQSTTDNPITTWSGTVFQYLGNNSLVNTSNTSGYLSFTYSKYFLNNQPLTVFDKDTNLIKGTFLVTLTGSTPITGYTGYTVTTITGNNNFVNGDKVITGARIPIYYIDKIVNSRYIWRRLPTSDFLGVTSGSSITSLNINTAIPQINNTTSGGFINMVDDRYYPMFLLATNITSEPVIALLGQGYSTTNILEDSLSEDPWQFSKLTGAINLEQQELVPFCRLTFKYNSSNVYSTIKLVDSTRLNVRYSTNSGSFLTMSPDKTSHKNLTSLDWVKSSHTGSINKLAGFDSSGIPSFYDINTIDYKKIISAQRTDNSSFYFNSITTSGNTSSNMDYNTAFLITNSGTTKVIVYLRSNQLGVNTTKVSLFKNSNGTDFASAVIMTELTDNLLQNTIKKYEFSGLYINQFDSLHIKIEPTLNPENLYGIIIFE